MGMWPEPVEGPSTSSGRNSGGCSGPAEVGNQPDLVVDRVVDYVDADVGVTLAQDVLAVSVVGRLLVVHRLLHGEYAVLRTASVVGNVFADRAPAVASS